MKINILNKILISMFLVFIACIFNVRARGLDISAKSGILICADTGSVVWSKDPDRYMTMASTTKIMTAVLALEYILAHGDKEIEITPNMIQVEGTSMGLTSGDIINLSSLVTGMMLCSGNDAANAISIAVSGDTQKFVELMNEKARLLNMSNTKFCTPSGLDKDDHHSCARDMAILGAYAMENEEFSNIVCQKSAKIKFINPNKTISYKNHNKLLRLYKYCTGIKTGFTKLSGRCLVSSAQKDGIKLICVTLNASNDWDDHMNLYNYGFENTILKNYSDENFRANLKIKNSDKEQISVGSVENFTVSLKSGEENLVTREVNLPDIYDSPVRKNQILGTVKYYLNNKIIGENKIIALEDCVEIKHKKSSFFESIINFFRIFLGFQN